MDIESIDHSTANDSLHANHGTSTTNPTIATVMYADDDDDAQYEEEMPQNGQLVDDDDAQSPDYKTPPNPSTDDQHWQQSDDQLIDDLRQQLRDRDELIHRQTAEIDQLRQTVQHQALISASLADSGSYNSSRLLTLAQSMLTRRKRDTLIPTVPPRADPAPAPARQNAKKSLATKADTAAAAPFLTCSHCGLEFRYQSALTEHIKSQHTTTIAATSGVAGRIKPAPKFECDFCQRRFSVRGHCERHMRTHTGERPYQCDVCERAFARYDAMMSHKKSRHSSADTTTPVRARRRVFQ